MKNSDPKIEAIEDTVADVRIEDDLMDIEFPESGVGGEPLDYYEDDFDYPSALDLMHDDDDVFETAESATEAVRDILDEDSDWLSFTGEEEEEVLALVVGNLLADHAQTAYKDADGDPLAAARAVMDVLLKARHKAMAHATRDDFGPIPPQSDEVLDPT